MAARPAGVKRCSGARRRPAIDRRYAAYLPSGRCGAGGRPPGTGSSAGAPGGGAEMGDAVADETAVEGRECAECLEAIAPGTEVTLRARGPDGAPLVVCDACAATMEARYQTE